MTRLLAVCFTACLITISAQADDTRDLGLMAAWLAFGENVCNGKITPKALAQFTAAAAKNRLAYVRGVKEGDDEIEKHGDERAACRYVEDHAAPEMYEMGGYEPCGNSCGSALGRVWFAPGVFTERRCYRLSAERRSERQSKAQNLSMAETRLRAAQDRACERLGIPLPLLAAR